MVCGPVRSIISSLKLGNYLSVQAHKPCSISHLLLRGLSAETRPRSYKTFSMLNSVEHEILNAHKYKNIKKFSFLQAQMSLECYFSCS